MSCPSNKKKWFVFKWFGPCDPEDFSIRMRASGSLWVRRQCKKCGCEMEPSDRTQQEMMFHGYSIEKLRKMSFFDKEKTAKDLLNL